MTTGRSGRSRGHAAWSILIVALLMAASVPLGSSQDAGPTEMATDASDDVVVAAQDGTSQPDPATARPSVDLTAFTMEERATEFVFQITVAELGAQQEEASVFNLYWIHFSEDDENWRIQVSVSPSDLNPFAQVRKQDSGSGNYFVVTQAEAEADAAAGTITVVAPREAFRDDMGAVPYPGKTFTDFTVHAFGERIFAEGFNINGQSVEGAYLMDRMPDEGVADSQWPIAFGVEQTGHVMLASEEPFRFSNGEATTFVYRIMAANNGDGPDRLEMSFSGAPADWDVRTPQSTIRVDAGEVVEVPVVVRTVFSHEHGRTQTILMEAQSASDPVSVGRIEFGIHYPEIPQPTGHHDTVWLHSEDFSDSTFAALGTAFGAAFGGDGTARLFMNADDDAETDDEVPVQGRRCGFSQNTSGVTTRYCWDIYLEPALKLGIDMDLEDVGEIEVPLSTLVPMPAARLGGYFEHIGPPEQDGFFFNRERTRIAEIKAGDPKDINAASSGTLTASIVPLEEGDFIEYARDAGLRLRLEVSTERPDNPLFGPGDMPTVEPGAMARLPLDEYEDPVDDVFGADGAIALTTDTPQKPVNPGEARLYNVTLTNNGPLEDAFKIDLAGSNLEWAQVLTGGAVTVSAGETATINVAVQAPGDAPDGERVDLILEAASSTDPNARALLRLLTTVDTEADHPDDTGAAEGISPPGEESPAPALLAGVAVLGGLAAAWRRRQ